MRSDSSDIVGLYQRMQGSGVSGVRSVSNSAAGSLPRFRNLAHHESDGTLLVEGLLQYVM